MHCFICGKKYKPFNHKPEQHQTYIRFSEDLCKDHLEMLYHYNWMHYINDGLKDYKFIESVIKGENIKTVGELGCGPGLYYLNHGSKLSIDYTGLDLRNSAIMMATVLNPNAQFGYLNIYESSETPQIYDLFFSRHVMMHQEDLKKFLEYTLPYGNTILHIQTRPFDKQHVRRHDYGENHKFHGEKVVNHWSNVYSKQEVETITEPFSDTFDISVFDNYLIAHRKKNEE